MVREHVRDGSDVEDIALTAAHFEQALEDVEPQESDETAGDVDTDSLVAEPDGGT